MTQRGDIAHGLSRMGFCLFFSFGFYYFLLGGAGGREEEMGVGHIPFGTWMETIIKVFSFFFFFQNLMDRFLHWDRDKECILFIEQWKFDFALQGRGGGPAAGRAPARGGELSGPGDLFFVAEKKTKTPPPRIFGFFFIVFFSLSIYICKTKKKKKRFNLQPRQKGRTSYNLLSCPPNYPLLLHTYRTHTDTQ